MIPEPLEATRLPVLDYIINCMPSQCLPRELPRATLSRMVSAIRCLGTSIAMPERANTGAGRCFRGDEAGRLEVDLIRLPDVPQSMEDREQVPHPVVYEHPNRRQSGAWKGLRPEPSFSDIAAATRP